MYVVGDVLHPGSYRISSAGTALGPVRCIRPTDNGSLRNIQIKRGGKTSSTSWTSTTISSAVMRLTMRGCSNGDVVFVPGAPESRARRWRSGPACNVRAQKRRNACRCHSLCRRIRSTAARNRVQIERIQAPNQRGEGGRDRITIDVASRRSRARRAARMFHCFRVTSFAY